MPTTTPNQKVSQVKLFGGEYVEIMQVGAFDASAEATKDYDVQENAAFIAPFADLYVIAG